MHYRKLESAVYITSLFLLLLSTQGRSEFRVDIESTNNSAWGGFIKSEGTKLVKTRDHTGTPLEKSEGSAGIEKTVDLNGTSRIIFYAPKSDTSAKPYEDGPLPPPWIEAAIGPLPRGGSVKVKNGSILVETSSPERNEEFGSFYMAYRPISKTETHVTTKITRIDTYEQETKSGIMIRKGTDPNAESVFLALSHRRPASIHYTKEGETISKIDSRSNSRPGHWIRLTREGGKITGFVSADGEFWRQLRSFPDKMGEDAIACLVGQGRKPRRRWATIFDHLQIGTLEELGSQKILHPKIALIDGTIFHSPIQSANKSIFKLGGVHSGKVIPLLTISRIEFHHPIENKFDEFLDGRRNGVLLSNGDFFECDLTGIFSNEEDVEMVCRSTLFGERKFDLTGSVDALVLRPASKKAPPGLPCCILTWQGGRIYGRNLKFKDNEAIIDTIRLRTQNIPLKEIKTIITNNKS
ncbi:MAG: hypothetical protein OSB44_12105 [Verrucomicrobiales bacterium]|nr:hypothetical protein [Verrucomicrobiales bacterium]